VNCPKRDVFSNRPVRVWSGESLSNDVTSTFLRPEAGRVRVYTGRTHASRRFQRPGGQLYCGSWPPILSATETSFPPPIRSSTPQEPFSAILHDVSSGVSGGIESATGDPYVRMSASKVPNQKAVANVGSLPLGAMVTPFAAAASGAAPVVLRRDPARCARCLAFISGFCEVFSFLKLRSLESSQPTG
jgi:hypothetical protein